MAGEEVAEHGNEAPHDAPPAGKPKPLGNLKGDKGDKRRAYISIAVGIVGVIVAYVLYRRQQAGSQAASSSAGASPYTYPTMPNTGGYVAGAGGGGAPAISPSSTGSEVGTGTGDQSSGGAANQVGGGPASASPPPPVAGTVTPDLTTVPSVASGSGYGLDVTAYPGAPGLAQAPYPGAPPVGLVAASNVPGNVYQPPGALGVPTGGYAATVGNVQVGVLPAWQAANNEAIANHQPIPYATPPKA